ncbi:MAG: Gfo/Idh/MocA family oxidoreductase [Planctomycetes bacterium]|nr:Gfo/Idh/MocA family oxidoreductase [Planctomycetota bacterium]
MTTTPKRIAFIDHDLENWHANTFHRIISTTLAARGFTVSGCWAQNAERGRQWAVKTGVPFIEDAAALDRMTDHYMVLAPSNPETHLELCRRVVPFGKPTYVDKTFAPTIDAAQAIFALADRHGVALQTSSALRYTNVQAVVAAMERDSLRHMVVWGGGSSFGEYAIHPVELVVSCMGAGATAVMRRGSGNHAQLLVDFTGGRTAVVNVSTEGKTPFMATLTTAAGTTHVPVIDKALFDDTTAAILDFFTAGRAQVERDQSLMIRRILDAAEQPAVREGLVPLAAASALAKAQRSG